MDMRTFTIVKVTAFQDVAKYGNRSIDSILLARRTIRPDAITVATLERVYKSYCFLLSKYLEQNYNKYVD